MKSRLQDSLLCLLIWGLSALFLGVYAIIQDLNIPLAVQPQLFGFLSFVSWGQCMYYDKKKSLYSALLMTGTLILVVGGLEVGFVFALRPSMNIHGIQFFGVFASVLIACGLLPQYWEIAKRREVVGISLLFLSIDILGAVFSDLSLVFREKFDILAFILYTLVLVMDGVIVIAAAILNPLARKRRQGEVPSNRPRQLTISSTPNSTLKWKPFDFLAKVNLWKRDAKHQQALQYSCHAQQHGGRETTRY